MRKIILAAVLLSQLAGCSNSEEEARTLLNHAIQDWDRGELASAVQAFDQIEEQYLHTAAATDALKERAARVDNYRLGFGPEANQRRNQGMVSRDVLQHLEAVHQRSGRYPAGLSEGEDAYQGQFAAYLEHCSYQSRLPQYGYQLDCSKADVAYQQEQMRNARSVGGRHLRRSGDAGAGEAIKFAGDLLPAASTWGSRLNPSGDIPTGQFQAFYINTKQPQQVIATETVDNIAINYVRDDFHGIESGDFGGYWVGNLMFEEPTVKRISVSQSWAKSRVLIDGRVLYEGGSDQSMLYRFEPGVHKLEVEYVNNWHTTEFNVDIGSEQTYLEVSEVRARLGEALPADVTLYYAGVYESSAQDLSIVLNLERTEGPVALVLSSYSPVRWYLSNPFGVDVRAVVYGAYKPGSRLDGDLPESLLRLPAKSRIGSYRVREDCSCTAGTFHCSGGSLGPTLSALKGLTGVSLSGFSGSYSASALAVPATRIDEAFLAQLAADEGNIASQRAACKAENDPDFETLLGEP
ncbi:hypothetical protein GCM10007421_25330 [Halopseudomonas oceani]|nr:hypothetical protein [Halopseudomonas oceani]GGE49958.1 hypothetical protein GCM10007421_25330 [Halopseudomonas oceani]